MTTGSARALRPHLGDLPAGFLQIVHANRDANPLAQRPTRLDLIDHRAVLGIHDLQGGLRDLQDGAPASLLLEVQQRSSR